MIFVYLQIRMTCKLNRLLGKQVALCVEPVVAWTSHTMGKDALLGFLDDGIGKNADICLCAGLRLFGRVLQGWILALLLQVIDGLKKVSNTESGVSSATLLKINGKICIAELTLSNFFWRLLRATHSKLDPRYISDWCRNLVAIFEMGSWHAFFCCIILSVLSLLKLTCPLPLKEGWSPNCHDLV